MNKRFGAIAEYAKRFKAVLTNWAAMHGFFSHARLRVGFTAHVQKQMRVLLNSGIGIGFGAVLRHFGKIRSGIVAGVDFMSKLCGRFKFGHSGGFEAGVHASLRRKAHFKARKRIGIRFVARYVRKRPLETESGIKAGFYASPKKKGRLYFRTRRLTVFTMTLLKKLTVGDLKKRNVETIKRAWRYMPEFRIMFIADLRKQESTRAAPPQIIITDGGNGSSFLGIDTTFDGGDAASFLDMDLTVDGGNSSALPT